MQHNLARPLFVHKRTSHAVFFAFQFQCLVESVCLHQTQILSHLSFLLGRELGQTRISVLFAPIGKLPGLGQSGVSLALLPFGIGQNETSRKIKIRHLCGNQGSKASNKQAKKPRSQWPRWVRLQDNDNSWKDDENGLCPRSLTFTTEPTTTTPEITAQARRCSLDKRDQVVNDILLLLYLNNTPTWLPPINRNNASNSAATMSMSIWLSAREKTSSQNWCE